MTTPDQNAFTAPSTASFGGSGSDDINVDNNMPVHVVAPALSREPSSAAGRTGCGNATGAGAGTPTKSMAEMIGNMPPSAGSTPLSYEFPPTPTSYQPLDLLNQEEKKEAEQKMNVPQLPLTADWRSALGFGSPIVVFSIPFVLLTRKNRLGKL